MKVIRARVLGFCMGVRRAVKLAKENKTCASRVLSPGQLVHNPKVLADLEKNGIETVDILPENLEGCAVIIRAHGIDPVIEKDLADRGARIIDATCPKVKSCQLTAQKHANAGCCLFIAGEKNHAEVEGIIGYANEAPFRAVVSGAEEALCEAGKLFESNAGMSPAVRTALIGQTTISQEEYFGIGEATKKYFPDLLIEPTICGETTERQNALRELLDTTDAVIITGGRASSNTRRLLSMAEISGKPCALVENADEIPQDFFSLKTIGLSAGASTPDSVIDEIEQKLLQC